ncbi:MAG: FAD-dependent oxidoreductase, partial [Kiloniellales bacterium]|nr:FAD-dependent oxidoreductase [Kiloniellales bacterium]
MQSHARVVIVGGGVTGCSILYHLAKMGWRDVVLLERKELTSGSSWHAAGGLFALTAPNNAAALQKYTLELYPELEKESGQDCGLHFTGGISVIRSEEEVTALKVAVSRGRRLGIEADFISFEEAKEKFPLLDPTSAKAILYEPLKGHCDPASVTHAYAKAARNLGAVIYRHTEVLETQPTPDGGWRVATSGGDITCEVLVNAAGLWGREVAAMAGITLPLLPVEHHYLVTESIPEIEALDRRLVTLADKESGCYMRQEGQGLLLGAYEKPCTHWAVAGTPLDFDHELLPDDLGRMEKNFARMTEIVPALGEVGVKRVINGPMIFSPDLGPLIGPYPGLRNYFCANGVMTAFNQGGGIGKVLAEWIIEGEPSLDVFFWDVARFGDWAGKRFTAERTKYFYEHRTSTIYPGEEFEAGRPVRTTPVYPSLKDAGAVFGLAFGLEVPQWYAPKGTEARDRPSFQRPNWHGPVGDECRSVRETAGLFEISGFGKLSVTGAGAADWLDLMLANRVPREPGRAVLSPLLSEKGRLIGDFSVTCLAEGRYFLLGSGAMQLAHMRHFAAHLPLDGFPSGEVEIENLSNQLTGLMVAGPAARDILQAVSDCDLSNEAFPFMTARVIEVGLAPSIIAVRVSFTGELGWELYCRSDYQRALYHALLEA